MGKRVYGLDLIRGCLIIFVCWYHLMFDLNVFYNIDMDWFWKPWPVQGIRDYVVALLMLLSGIASTYSKSNTKRGLKTFAIGMGITLISSLIPEAGVIQFGILHCFGVCMILWGLFQKWLVKVPFWVGIPLVIGFVFLRRIHHNELLFPILGAVSLPDFLYQSPFLFWLGFPQAEFFSSDYYPIIPWGLMFFAGGFFAKKIPAFLDKSRIKWLEFIGRKTLIIYLVHQPLFLGILWLIFAGRELLA